MLPVTTVADDDERETAGISVETEASAAAR